MVNRAMRVPTCFDNYRHTFLKDAMVNNLILKTNFDNFESHNPQSWSGHFGANFETAPGV
jgi:hypothetical protein